MPARRPRSVCAPLLLPAATHRLRALLNLPCLISPWRRPGSAPPAGGAVRAPAAAVDMIAAAAFTGGNQGCIPHGRDALADEFLDRRDALGVCRRRNGDGGAAPACAPRSPYAVHVIFRMVRHVEVEYVAHR